MTDPAILAGLFLAAFAAATILPMQSEAALVALLLTGDYPAWLLVVTASAGNVLGSVANWLIGRVAGRFGHRKWFPAKQETLVRARRWYARYGRWSLLLSWLPIVGDPLTVVAGMARESLATFLLLVSIAKAGRYLALAAATPATL